MRNNRLWGWLRQPYNVYLVVLGVVTSLPILAPILLKLSDFSPIFYFPAKITYFLYSFFCHQFHHRSIHLFDYQIAWCSRDMGIWLGVLAGAVAIKYLNFRKLRWYWVIPFMIPIALDGVIQTIATMLEISPVISGEPIYISNNLVRFLTGSIFGLGLSLWLSGVVQGAFAQPSQSGAIKSRLLKFARSSFAQSAVLIAALLSIYVGFIGLWEITSDRYHPSDVLDTAVKTPASDFYVRRLNGICPTTSDDLFNWQCFFN
jgi:uncharacterized membrane protein